MAHQRLIGILLITILCFSVCALFGTRSSFYAFDQIEAKVERLDPAANEILPQALMLKKACKWFQVD